MSAHHIHIRGARVHNLRNVDLDVPHGQLIVFCGVSGSGKTSLALDTLYAEGRRRYIESFSAYTRQFLEQLEKPDVEHIDGLPPAVAVTHKETSRSARATIGAATEIDDYLRLLFAKIGHVFCAGCGREVRRDSPATAASRLEALPAGSRFLVCFAREVGSPDELPPVLAQLREDGFVRALVGDRLVSTTDDAAGSTASQEGLQRVFAVVDRLAAGSTSLQRVLDSLETAFAQGGGRAWVFVESGATGSEAGRVPIEGTAWDSLIFSSAPALRDLRARLSGSGSAAVQFQQPVGGLPVLRGLRQYRGRGHGSGGARSREVAAGGGHCAVEHAGLRPRAAGAAGAGWGLRNPGGRAVPAADGRASSADSAGGAGAELRRAERFFCLAGEAQVQDAPPRVRQPLAELLPVSRLRRGAAAAGGLGTRVGGQNIADIQRAKITDVLHVFRTLPLSEWERRVGRMMLEQIVDRLGFLERVGLGYLSLDRTLRTLSGGEAQRVALTSALGSSLVNMLYVLDEPSVGLHPRDVHRLIGAIQSLRDRGNTVVLVEHEETMLRAADRIVELGPGAGERGGEVVFQGNLRQLLACENSLTGDFLTGRRGVAIPERRRSPNHGWIRLAGARGNNLRNLTVEFPLGVLCLVTGVSGAGKSTLVQDTLYPALCRRKRKEAPKPFPFDDVYGDGQIDDVILIDQSPIGRSPRSNPVTYVKAFDEIRTVFAETVEARTRNYSAGHFSFNVEGGRCPACEGDGYIQIDMQFLADVYMKCDQCQGKRYRREILDITYRGRNIAEVLDMTVREAFTFFRGQAKVQQKLKRLIDVGLDYLRLGQPANTLSAARLSD